jgi:methionyl aminopeptidase
VPEHIERPDYADDGVPKHGQLSIYAKEGELADAMRRASRISREVLDCAVAAARAGVTTDEIDAVAHAAAIERGAYPSPLGYRGFPKAAAISLNEIICHGIPDSTALQVRGGARPLLSDRLGTTPSPQFIMHLTHPTFPLPLACTGRRHCQH